MSYDITLMPRRPGQDWDEALEESNGTEVADRAELLRVWSRIEARLRDVLTGQVESFSSEPGSEDSTIGELSALDTGIQVELFPGQAAVSFAYWEQDDPEDFHRQVREAVRIVAEETGYAAYDPQTDAEFDGTFDDEPGLTFTQQLRDQPAADQPATEPAGDLGAQASHVQPTAEVDAYLQRVSAQQPRPFYSGRRRATTYLVIGAVVTAVALWLIVSGEGGPLAWVGLGIGIFDLVVGAVSWRSSSRSGRPAPTEPGT